MRLAQNMKELRLKFEGVARWHAFCKRQELIQAARKGQREEFWAGKGVVAFAESVLLSYDMIHLRERQKIEEDLKAHQSREGRDTG